LKKFGDALTSNQGRNMVRIRVDPDQLRSVSAELQRVLGDLQALENRVGNAWSGLDWEARQRVGIESQVNAARSRANTLATQADSLARYLTTKAQTFEEADRSSAQAVAGLAQQWIRWQADYRSAQDDLAQARNSKWWLDMQKHDWGRRFDERDLLLRELERDDNLCALPLPRIHDLDEQIKQLESKRRFWRDDALEAEIARLQDLRSKYARFYLLDDMIRQGIPPDGPTDNKVLDGLYGCTNYAASRRNLDSWTAWGNGYEWTQNARDAGWETGTHPLKGAIISFQPGASYFDESAGINKGLNATYGHVVVVEEVDWISGDKIRMRITEGNWSAGMPAGPGKINDLWITLDRADVEQGRATFIYGPARIRPDIGDFVPSTIA
jgi:surface antigen/uncharacterized protein YukE